MLENKRETESYNLYVLTEQMSNVLVLSKAFRVDNLLFCGMGSHCSPDSLSLSLSLSPSICLSLSLSRVRALRGPETVARIAESQTDDNV